MSLSPVPAVDLSAPAPAPTDGQPELPPSGSPGNRASPHPHPCGRPIDIHTPVVVAETGPLVPPLPVVTLAPASSGGAVAEVNVDPSSGTPMLQEIVVN